MSSNNGFAIQCGQPDARGRCKVVAKLGDRFHPHTFDPFDQFQRSQFRNAVVDKFDLPEDAHEHIEAKILAAADSTADFATLNVINMADVVTKKTAWFWEPYIPAAAITDLSGDPNEGKSTLAIDLMAPNSRGDSPPPFAFPDGAYEAADSLLLSGEDDPERTVKPRLIAAGAEVSRVHLLRTVTVCDEPRHVQLPMDLPLIERFIIEKKINFTVIDVLAAFTEQGTSLNDDASMRRLFNDMSSVFERTGAACLMLRHQNKKEGTRAMYRAGGSIAITGAARAAFAVGQNPDDADEKIFVPIKHNLGPRPHSLSYRIEAHGDSSRIVWGGQSDLTAADVLKGQSESGGGNKTDKAKGIIADVLSGGPRGENEVKQACEAAGISNSTYWRARRQLEVRSEKTGYQGEWLLSIPGANNDEPIPD
jgi:putative DNA primase/helicase